MGEALPQSQEVCSDNLDNNCNGQVDEGCCDLKVTGLSGSSATIDPDAGGSVTISGSISDSSGKPITWTLTYPGGSASGSGSSASATWDGRIGGKFAGPGMYAATLSAQNTAGCSDSKSVNIKVEWTKDCKLQITFGSSANAASGNLSHSQTLFSSKGMGLSTNMTLYYNSLDPYAGSLGVGWVHSYDIGLTENSDGSAVLKEGDGDRRLFTKSGSGYISQPGDHSVLTKNTDGTFLITQNDGTKYNFNQNGKIATIVDRNSNAMTFTYTNGNLTTIIDPAGRTTTLNYDTSNHITSITDPSGNVCSFTVSNNMLTSVAYPGGGTWSYTYDADAFMLTKTDPNGNTTTYTYDDQHRVASSLAADGSTKLISYPTGTDTTKTTTFTETNGGVWQYTYDTQAGTLTSKTDPQGGVTSYTYDSNRNMTSKTDPDGSATSYSYDASANMTSTTDALGQTTSYTYNSFGQVSSITDPQSGTTAYSYDAKGNLLSTTDPAGATTKYEYNTKGNVVKVTNSLGQSTVYSYDQAGNLVSVTDPIGATTKFTYDANGNITSQTDANGNTTTFAYDSQNHLMSVTDPAGNTTTYAYDKNGNRTSQTDANGNTTKYEYNYNGQLIKVTDALGNVTTYTYGSTGCPSCGGGVDKLTSVTDANEHATTYQYDTFGRLIMETDLLGNSITYSYDAKGNLISKTDANGNTITYSYDGLGRLLKKAYPDQTTETFTYDSKGNILTATNANISYTFTYDADSRIINVTDSNSRTVSYHYNALGNKTQMIYPEGSKVTYSYDNASRLISMVNGGGKTYSFSYDKLGRRSKLALPNGATTNYSYDSAGRLTNLTHTTSTGQTIASFGYSLDKVGNRLNKTTIDTQYTYSYDPIYRLIQALSSTPGYSGNATGKGSGVSTAVQQQKEFYTYDPVGNRLTSDKVQSYIYNQANQLLANGGIYTYDKNGNLIFHVTGSMTFSYSYDYESRLTKVTKNENGTITISEFKYDPFGRRIEKKITENGTITDIQYVYDRQNIILEYDGNGSIGNRYIQGPGIDEHLAVVTDKDIYYYHSDALSSVVALTDSSGKVQQTYEYDSFGNLKDQKNKIKQPFTFTGREWDKEAGLYYYRARYYDAKAGRFISFDPILHPSNGPPRSTCNKTAFASAFEDALNTPLKLNPFIYTQDNPLNLTDPHGLFSITGNCCGKESQIRSAVQNACNNLAATITDSNLRNCIQSRCNSATIECESSCDPGVLGYNYGIFGIRFHTAHICSRTPFSGGLFGQIGIHEWAHSCGWNHGNGKGVPGDSGYLP